MFYVGYKGFGICQEAAKEYMETYGHIRGQSDFTKHQKLMMMMIDDHDDYDDDGDDADDDDRR